MRKFPVVLAAAATLAAVTASASAALGPLSTFGGGDGWLAPGEGGYQFLGTGNLERGLAYNPSTAHLLLVSRANVAGSAINIRILDAITGLDLGALNNGTAGFIAGGTFPVNMVGVGTDGAIYVNNLTTNSTTSPYKIYRWANEAATAPTLAYTGDAGLAGSRAGDTFDVHDGGNDTIFASGYSNAPAVAGNNAYVVHSTANGSDYTATRVVFPATPPNAGDFRLGLSFVDNNTVLGRVGGAGNPLRVTDFAGANGTLVASPTLIAGSNERLMDVAVIDGKTFLAIQSTGDSFLRIYDISDPANPIFYDAGTTTTGALTANTNGVGQVKWGALTALGGTVYAMSTNHGIQAFSFVVPEPASIGLITIAATGLLRRRG
jgi:hypothetical protein